MPRPPSALVPSVNIAAFLLSAGVLAATIVHPPWMKWAFTHLSYYFILTMTIVWAVSLLMLWREHRPDLKAFWKRSWTGLVCSLALAGVVFVSVPKYFRVLSDETNLLSVAKSMTFHKTVHNITEGKFYYEMFWPTFPESTEKRPFLFPFFTSLVHQLLGYHIENVFVLNFFVLWAVLFLLYALIRSSLGGVLAFSSVVLVVSQPVLTLSAASGSYELFNFLFILASFVSLRFFLKNPGNAAFLVLVMNLVMLANVRYESVLFFGVTMLILMIAGYVRLEYFKRSPAYALVPLFFFPWIWQRVLMLGESDSNLTGGSWVQSFQLGHVAQNIGVFFRYILNVNGELGYAGALNIVGLASILSIGCIFLFQGNPIKERGGKVAAGIGVVGLLSLLAVALLYQGGINDHPLNGRLYIPILAALSVLPVYLLSHCVENKERLAAPVLLGSLVVFLAYHPVAVEDRLSNTLFIVREYRFVDSFLKKHADRNTLVICGRPGQLIVSNYGAISYSTANQDADEVLDQYRNRLYSRIYAIQSISYQTREPLEDNVIDARYELDTVAETQITGDYFFRISRVRVPR